ncbi:hypothetical protein H0H81_006230 [Sphagnurus paluster]|uniref:RING-type domain-containing protein n=1 Tax=Sphagnurus paluster TaxID=117069 RepID=A0A9P7GP34_9AGAR|nr:hypothetical protein H0H81_006230 [Sphagnurus paluster]
MPLPDPEAPHQSLGDCAICMDDIVVEARPRSGMSEGDSFLHSGWDAEAGGGKNGGLFSAMQMGIEGASARKIYSLAPCHHLFHTECLEKVFLVLLISILITDHFFLVKWLAIKNICPQCRRPLPPL